MTRTALAGLLAVLALVAGGLVVRGHEGATAPADALGSLRSAAALQPCPVALGPAFPAGQVGCLGDGRPVQLSGRPTGRPMLVNLWATWCGPCVKEVPTLVAFAAKARGKVDVVGVVTSDEPGDALRFAAQFGMHYPNLDDQDGVVRRRFAPGLPATLLVDPEGRVVEVKLRAFASEREIEALVADRLGVRT